MIGAILAGGEGRRLGGGKAVAVLAGRALAAYAADALAAVCDRVAVVAKRDSAVPELVGVERWHEPDEPRHPLTGIIHALERAEAPVLVCGVDMPFVTAEACRSVLMAAGASGGSRAAVASGGGVLQPVLAVYAPSALDDLRAAPPGTSLTATVEALRPVRVALPPPLLAGVNTPEELAAAEAMLRSTARDPEPPSRREERSEPPARADRGRA